MQEQNKFGALSKQYRLARRGYPVELYSYLQKLAPGSNVKVLDIGCGTGISTRELKHAGFDVVGLDKEEAMLAIARQDSPGIEFIRSDVEKMPFADNTFDIVTAFNAYHWFDTDAATTEIRRILKPGGVFMASLKNEIEIDAPAKVQKEYKDIFKKYVGERYTPVRNYHPVETLERNGFADVEEIEFERKDHYTVDEALLLTQSFSAWNLVPIDQQLNMLDEFRALFEQKLKGVVIHDAPVESVVGFKR